jgi:hypothetical protein
MIHLEDLPDPDELAMACDALRDRGLDRLADLFAEIVEFMRGRLMTTKAERNDDELHSIQIEAFLRSEFHRMEAQRQIDQLRDRANRCRQDTPMNLKSPEGSQP